MNKLLKIFQVVIVIFSGMFILEFLYITISRIGYPYELEWMEGGTVVQVIRILSGDRLYVKPTIDFIPYIYTPLYFYFSAGISKLLNHVSFFEPRLVSLISSLGIFLTIFFIIYRETRSKIWGFISTCLYAGTFAISGRWFDIARVDNLCLLLLLLGLYVIRIDNSRLYILGGLFFSLAFFTKQTALFVIVPVLSASLLYQLWLNHTSKIKLSTGLSKLAVIIISTSLLIGLGIYLLDVIHEGWFSYYVFKLSGKHEIFSWQILSETKNFLRDDLLDELSITVTVIAIFLLAGWSKAFFQKYFLYILFTCALLGTSWIGRVNPGSYPNVMIFAYSGIAIMFGIACAAFLDSNRVVLSQNLKTSLLYIICFMQFFQLMYFPNPHIPTSQDVAAGEKLIAYLKDIKGEVYMPFHSYYPLMAGKKTSANWMALNEILGGLGDGDPVVAKKLRIDLENAITEKDFDVLMLDVDFLQEKINLSYMETQSFFSNNDVFFPVVGWQIRPNRVFLKK